ncbi:P-loop NTPase [Altererythrobacter arenosus]|uniref:P-loop NTPase n=1 Tax=Altererythrobacter arenosus TaxID=3032592 RepID=A0ABY8FQ98_9SPHN|nr:P-loop NTPase [Altererythrobacter sp. CAU 1644]WFL77189.1 P-loop NTPase [Altererythrobacter sp. CAU 1644]
MTEHSKITTDKARPIAEGGSLLERASGSFGLDALKPISPPRDLPAPAARAPQARSVATKVASNPTRSPAVPPATRASKVTFSGPRQAVDRDLLRENGIIDSSGGVTELLEEFRIVRRELLGDARENGSAEGRRILVCSPHPGEGKTYCATNLAIAMAAERGIEVLLIDADFAKPSIPGLLGISPGKGLMDCLADPSLAPESLVIATDIEGLFVLPAGNRTTRDTEYLGSARTRDVLDRLTADAPDRIVIFDTPPALAASPAAELAKHVGQSLLIVRADVTGQSALEDAYQLLSACPDIKLLLNGTHYSPSGRSFGSYAGYGSE